MAAMDRNELLAEKFINMKPPAPEVISRSHNMITLDWQQGLKTFAFLRDQLLFKVERKEKIPPWVVVYCGGRTSKTIENLAPRHPHKFRLKVILKPSFVNLLEESAIKCYGDVEAVCKSKLDVANTNNDPKLHGNENMKIDKQESCCKENVFKDGGKDLSKRPWLESQWSEETWTSTDSDGSSAVCFCMAVQCGYIKQVQGMIEERPELIDIPSSNGLTPLAIAIRKGDINTIRFLLQFGADVNLPLRTGQTPLHLAVLMSNLPVIDLLLEKEANFLARDINGLHVEHYAVDSCNLDVVKYILDKNGDVNVKDNNGWTPLFRAVCQGATTEIIEELVHRGGSVGVTDNAGLTLIAAARLLKDKSGRRRDSVLRQVDASFVHEKALAHFSRLTKKISSVQALLK